MELTKFTFFSSFTGFWIFVGLKDWRKERVKEDLKGLIERLTFDKDWLIGDGSLILFSPYYSQIIRKIAIWMLAEAKITKTRKAYIPSKLRHEILDDVMSNRMTSKI